MCLICVFLWVVSLQTLPDEERDRVLTEEKLGGSRLSIISGSHFVSKSPSAKVGSPYFSAKFIPPVALLTCILDASNLSTNLMMSPLYRTGVETLS